jgi:16S rRNA C967 or C1407 C5-methylase (RsmB/RsmF family)/NOL1/NOP2/fmu family ribosome biogenesis protein
MARVEYPLAYLQLMRDIMQEDYDAWLAAQDTPLFRVVRLNPTKISMEEFLEEFPLAIRLHDYPGLLFRMPESETSLGNHPFHHAGCFYIQEPSASLPVEAMRIEKNDKVLDCCAAPGGKSTQIFGSLESTGLLISNEIDSPRNRTLRFNLQRFGDDNLLVLQNDIATLGQTLRGTFDKILIDAPCSGMGMFRKDPEGLKYFSQKNIDHCVKMQGDILDNVYPALKENGILVYSTCTFTLEENEVQIASFIDHHPDMVIEELPFSVGRPGLSDRDDLRKCRRITLLEGGEGQFICRMRKTKGEPSAHLSTLRPSQNQLIQNTLDDWLNTRIPFYEMNGHIYLSRYPLPVSDKLRIMQAGVHLGDVVKGRIEPDHAFALSKIASEHFKQRRDLSLEQTLIYLRGETLPIGGIKGYVLLTYRKKPIGFGKGDGSILKNHFPKGLRSLQKFSEKEK